MMTQRQLDRAVLAGIGVLLLVILGLALSPAPTTAAGDISDPAARAPRVDALPASQSDALPPEGAARADRTVNSAAVSEPQAVVNNSVNTARGVAPTRDRPANETTVQTPAQPATGVPVARIGFAYATGNEGACGVALTAWAYVAVSRDLLQAYPCGTAVTLTFNDKIAGRSAVTAQVGDTMGADITDTVNVFVGQDEPALEYGVTSGTLAQ